LYTKVPMPPPATVVITGPTGYIGRHLLIALLRRGYRVIAIARRRHGLLEQRFADVLARLGKEEADRLHVVAGDLTRPLCGVDEESLAGMKRAQGLAFVHGAGLTRFDAHLEDELRRHNLEGARHSWALCRRLGIPEFHHISTAFVAGDHAGVWGEHDLERGQGFRNPYEASKFEAERYLHGVPGNHGPAITIYRPSIVVGGQAVGEGRSTSTVYTFLKTLHFLRECCKRDRAGGRGRLASLGVSLDEDAVHVPMRVAGDPEARINLVSIWQVVDTIVHCIGRSAGGLETRHIIGRDFDLEETRDRFCAGMAVSGIRYVPDHVFEKQPRNPLEERFYRATRVYHPYMHAAPRFDPGRGAGRDYPVDLLKLVGEFKQQMDDAREGAHADNLGGMSMACLGVDSAQHYFERLIRKDFGFDFLRRWRHMDTCIRFSIKGPRGFDRTIRFANESARFTTHEAAVCRYEMNEETFHQITYNRLDPRQAFFKGLVTIDGDKEVGLKFAFFLSDYLRCIDEHVITELSTGPA